VRDQPILLPVDGSLTTTLTHADDVAGMMASVVGREAQAKGQVFNCANDVRISHQELTEMIAGVVGKQPRIAYYDPAKLKGLELPKKGKFPFRETHFGVGVDKAKIILGWKPEHDLKEDLAWYYAEYRRLGNDQGDIALDWDKAVMAAGAAGAPAAAPAAAAPPSTTREAAALIVQNKGGGHGEIGYHLALSIARRMKVTMVVDSAAKRDKPPFDSYGDLEVAGVEIKWADLANGGLAAALEGIAPCDYVFDNQNVCPQDVQQAVAAWAPKAYAYVSSGGMYKPRGDKALIEVGEVKEDNKQLSIERNAASLGLNWSAFRPQYIYGPKTNKRDYIDWFLDRIVRDLPVPLPVDGSLTTTLTHAADVASMMASVIDKDVEAKGQVFNCASDVRISHKDLTDMIAGVVGKQPKIMYYDPANFKGIELPKKGKFPFRETHFGVFVEKAKIILGWKPEHKLEEDLTWYCAEYQRLGKDQGPIERDWDEVVLAGATAAPALADAAASAPQGSRPTAALVVQNKGGGHGELGYHLALQLAKNMKVTMIVDSAAKRDKPPFDSYGDLEAAGVEIRWADLENGGLAGALEGVAPCDYVFDNQNVCTQDVQAAVAPWSPKAYAYVSSGGMYKPRGDKPLIEVGDVKEDNKQLSLERNAASLGLNWSAYRPQYIYGPKTDKRDYIDWFLDRIVRELPIPLPVDGSLTTTLTHAADVASMMASVVGKESQAKGQVFNCATDVRISHKELTEMIAGVVGKQPKIVYYDPERLKGIELPKKGKFPFRETHFGVAVEKAKIILGWKPERNLKEDLSWYYAEYLRLGKDQGPIACEWDAAVLQRASLVTA